MACSALIVGVVCTRILESRRPNISTCERICASSAKCQVPSVQRGLRELPTSSPRRGWANRGHRRIGQLHRIWKCGNRNRWLQKWASKTRSQGPKQRAITTRHHASAHQSQNSVSAAAKFASMDGQAEGSSQYRRVHLPPRSEFRFELEPQERISIASSRTARRADKSPTPRSLVPSSSVAVKNDGTRSETRQKLQSPRGKAPNSRSPERRPQSTSPTNRRPSTPPTPICISTSSEGESRRDKRCVRMQSS